MMAKNKKPNNASSRSRKPKAATIPNLYWRGITMDQLREQERVIGLPHVADSEVLGRQSQRYVRQDSYLWSVLHDGMLTTGRLKAALGMHESAAAAVIGIHPGSRGSSHLLAAYSHLVSTTYSRRGMTTGSSSSSGNSSTAAAGGSLGSAAANKQQGQQQTTSLQKPFGGLLPRPVMLQPPAAPPQKQGQQQPVQKQFGGLLPRPVMLQGPAQQYSTQQQPPPEAEPQQPPPQQQQQQAEAAAVARLEASRRGYNQQLAQQEAGQDGSPGDGLLQQAAASASVEAARQHSQRVAAGGDMHVKMSWGKTQEAAALYCVMQLFPDALLEEVGLFELDPSQLPAAEPGLLPPLGASPDGVLVHKLTLLPDDLQAAAALLACKSSSSSSSTAATPAAAAGGSSSAGGDAAEAAAIQLLLQRGFDRLQCAGTRPSPNGVQYADSSEESVPSSSHGSSEAGSEPASHEDGADQQQSTGATSSSSSSSSSSSTQPGMATPAAASSSTAAQDGVNGSVSAALSAAEAGSLAFEPVAMSVLRVLRDWQQQPEQQQQPVSIIVREAVEVKNHCPFGVRFARSGKKGRTELAYKLSPRGCAGRVHPQWMPQLQLHMAATGCQSVLLASRCAAQGMRVYRVWRDDGYLRDMMLLLQELQACHVLRNIPPRPDSLSRLPLHRPFLRRTVALAKGAECIAAVGEEFVAAVPSSAVNQAQFWQPL